MDPGDVAPMIVVSMLALVTGAVMIFRGPLGRAIARRIEGGAGLPSPEVEARLSDLEHRLSDGEQERAELLERLEFAERVLLQAKDPQRELPR
ncbi:MAG: hypothetical protein FJ206_14935 [Gemmatimonadetes bacterium]|nr:hypothetical protein [Gemmatimonadota bacterium]